MNKLYPRETVLVPVPIVVTTTDKHTELLECVEKTLAWCSENNVYNGDGTNVVLRGRNHTPYMTQKICEYMQPVVDEMSFHAKQFFSSVQGFNTVNLDYTTCGEMWIAEYKRGDMAHEHQHYPYDIAMTYYCNIEDSTPIQFTVWDPEYGFIKKEVHPSDGMIVMFDGRIPHSVPHVKGNRTCVASNWYFDMSKHCAEGEKNHKKDLTQMT